MARDIITLGRNDEHRTFKTPKNQWRTEFTVLKEGWLGVTDNSLPDDDLLGDRTRDLLMRINVRSFLECC